VRKSRSGSHRNVHTCEFSHEITFISIGTKDHVHELIEADDLE
jgi:hypothetical protein